MEEIVTVGITLAKLPSCLIGVEACAGAHFWAWERARIGQDVRLMPPSYVTPYVKRGKTGAADAEAIWQAVTRQHAVRPDQDRSAAISFNEPSGAGLSGAPTHPNDHAIRAHPLPGRRLRSNLPKEGGRVGHCRA